MRRYLTPLGLFGALLAIVVLVSWFVFPGWHQQPGGFWTLIGVAALGVAAFLKDLVSVIKDWPKEEDATKPQDAPKINTGGGAYVDGDVNTGGGKFVGGDEVTNVYPPLPPTPPSALFTIPAPPMDFVGREAELTTLRDSFDRGALITGVTGSGGIGKTALARVLASAIAARFPAARLELDLRGTTQPLTPAEAQRTLLQPFYPGKPLPDDPDQLAGLYRQTFAEHTTLLLLDNAADAAQVRPLLPPAPSAAIVTSRVRFTLGEAGLHPVPLGLLSPEEARDLLRRAAPRLESVPDATLDALAERCGRLPLALRAAAALLAEREDWTPEILIAKLADEYRRLRTLRPGDPDLDVEAVLGLSYTTLEESVQGRFRALGVFPAPFEKSAACAVWACEDEEADGALGELERRNLADYHTETQDYALHDLTRCYAQARLLERVEEARAAVMYHAAYYLEQGSQANALYEQGGEHVVEGLRRFAGLWPHLQAAWGRLSGGEAGWPRPEGADRWLSDLPGRTAYVHDLILSPREQIPLHECALEAARRLGDRMDEGVHLGNLGIAYHSLGEVRRAIDYHEQALSVMRDIGDKRVEGSILGNLGLAYADLGEVRRAIEYYEQQLEITREIGNRRGEGNALGNLGNAYYSLGEVRRAIAYYEQQLEIVREIGDRRGEGVALGNLGNAYWSLGEVRRAIEYYEQRLEIAREIGDRRGEGAALANMGLAYQQLGDPDRARDLWQQALAIYEAIEDPNAARVREWLE